MKKFSKLLTILAVVMMVLTSGAVAVYADPTPGTDTKYTPVAGGNVLTFDKYFITNAGQQVPTVEFKYFIEPGEAKPYKVGTPEVWTFEGTDYASEQLARDAVARWNADPANVGNQKDFNIDVTHVAAVAGDFEIFAGIGTPKLSTASFGETSPAHHEKYDTVQTGDTLNPAKLDGGKVYSKDTISVDFTGIEFTEPGVYRYIVTEQAVGLAGVRYDTEAGGSMKRVIDVYVIDNPAGQLEIKEYVLHETVVTSIYTTENMGSKDEKVVATKWAISEDFERNPATATKYDTKDEADAEIARRRSLAATAPNFDTELEAKQREIDNKTAERDAKNTEYVNAGNNLNPPLTDLQTNVANAQTALDKLLNGDNPTGNIDDIISSLSSATDTSKDNDLRKFGKNALMAYLNTSTVAKEITVLRRVIGEDDTKALQKDIKDAEATLLAAQNALQAAQTALQTIQDEIDVLKAELKKLQDEYNAIVARHNQAVAIEIEWKLSDKSDHYTNEYDTFNLEFNKEVEGNQGSKDKYFQFTLKLGNLLSEKWVYEGQDYSSEALAIAAAEAKVKTETETVGSTTTTYYVYRGVRYTTQADAFAIADAEVVYVERSVVTVHSESIFTKQPSKNNATTYTTDAMRAKKANIRDDDPDNLTFGAADAEDKEKFVWTNPAGTDSFYWNGSEYVDNTGAIVSSPSDNYVYQGKAGQQLVADSSGNIEWTLYLKDGECIVIKDLPVGTTYEISELEEDYKKTAGTTTEVHAKPYPIKVYVFAGVEYATLADAEKAALASITDNRTDPNDPSTATEWYFAGNTYTSRNGAETAALNNTITDMNKIHNDPTSGTLTKNIYTGYTNTRDGIIPTGVFVAAGSGIAILGIGVIGILALSRRKEEDEDEE